MRYRALLIVMTAAIGLAALGAYAGAARSASSGVSVYVAPAHVHHQMSILHAGGPRPLGAATPVDVRHPRFTPDRHTVALAAPGQFTCCPQPPAASRQILVAIQPGAPARILLTDPRGRLVGTNLRTGKSVADIPTSKFFEKDHPAIVIDEAIPGKYTLDVLGIRTGGKLELVISFPNAFPTGWDNTVEEFSETIAPGQKLRFAFDTFAFQTATKFFADLTTHLKINATPEALDTHTAASFTMTSTFTLPPGADITPLTQPVVIQLGRGFLVLIPARSFHPTANGTRFVFRGTINGVVLEASLTPTSRGNYVLEIAGTGARSLPSFNPVEVRLGIGNYGGSLSVDAQFAR